MERANFGAAPGVSRKLKRVFSFALPRGRLPSSSLFRSWWMSHEELILCSSQLGTFDDGDKLGGRGTVRVVAALPPQGGWRRDHGWQLKEFAIEAHGCACEEDELANRSGAILGSFMVVRLRGDFGNTFEFETLDNNAEENAIRGYGLRG
ncbi:uncharacterized protein HKW66_Vig0202270 [Vigna angularis]|uniref:Uncharacterized protein n=1 Tax=Phaseolus angularis TaxID=3914 RepID=A0A8T0JRX0_PHAAN|nr:uncharacterized protein HKW66_Vig0202270 [Vigna angularis]